MEGIRPPFRPHRRRNQMTEVYFANAPVSHYEERMKLEVEKAVDAKAPGEVIEVSKNLTSIYKAGLQDNPQAQKRLSNVFSAARRELGQELSRLALEKLRG